MSSTALNALPSAAYSPAMVLHLPQPQNEDLERRGRLAASYDHVPTEWGTDPIEPPTLIGAESLLTGLEKNNLARRKRADPHRAHLAHINMSHVLHAGLAPIHSRYPAERTVPYKFVDDVLKPQDVPVDDTPLTMNNLGQTSLQVADFVQDTHPDQITHLAGRRKRRTKTSKLIQILQGTTTHDLATGESQNDGILAAGLRRKNGIARIRRTNARRDKQDRQLAAGQLGAYENILEDEGAPPSKTK